MSVLIEGFALVIPVATVDGVWPGGAGALVGEATAPVHGARHACRDETLVSVGFDRMSAAQRLVAKLRELGLVELNPNRATDLVIVDELKGPTLPCHWLAWKQHPDGYTGAWMANASEGALATPAGWVPNADHAIAIAYRRLLDDDRMFKLAEDERSETWLDFETGKVSDTRKPVASAAAETPGGEAPMGELLTIVSTALAGRGFTTRRFDESSIFGRMRTNKATYEVFVTAEEAARTVAFYFIFPVHAPEHARSAVAELCTRANWALLVGSLEMDFADGDVRFRAVVDVSGSALSAEMVLKLVYAGGWSLDHYHDALVKVMVTGEDPAEAFEAAQR